NLRGRLGCTPRRNPRHARDPPDGARARLDPDPRLLRRDVDLPEVRDVEGAVRAECAVAGAFEAVVGQLGGWTADPVHGKVDAATTPKVDADDLEPDGRH